MLALTEGQTGEKHSRTYVAASMLSRIEMLMFLTSMGFFGKVSGQDNERSFQSEWNGTTKYDNNNKYQN